MSAALRYLNSFSLVGSILFFGYFGFFEPPFLSYENLPFRPITPKVKPGDPVLLAVRRCNNDSQTRLYGTARALVSNRTQVILPAQQVSIPPGCHDGISSLTVIPLGTPPGIYHLEGLAEAQGTLRTSLVKWSSGEFEVSP